MVHASVSRLSGTPKLLRRASGLFVSSHLSASANWSVHFSLPYWVLPKQLLGVPVVPTGCWCKLLCHHTGFPIGYLTLYVTHAHVGRPQEGKSHG